MLPVLYDASRCMAMMNSVTLRAPRCSVSERFQMRPRTSLGNRAFSKISFAFSPVLNVSHGIVDVCIPCVPDRTPLMAPDFSKRPAYSAAFAGTSDGTRMGPFPLFWGCSEPVVCGEKLGAAGGADGMERPSNLGSGAAIQCQRTTSLHSYDNIRLKASSGEGSLPAW